MVNLGGFTYSVLCARARRVRPKEASENGAVLSISLSMRVSGGNCGEVGLTG